MHAGLKPKDQWDVEDWLDHLDGWHEASGLGFTSERDLGRAVNIYGPRPSDPNLPRPVIGRHPASALHAAGRTARERHRGKHRI